MPPKRGGPGALAGATEAGVDREYSGKRPDTTTLPDAATRATRGEPPATKRPRTIALVAWRPRAKGALRGFMTVKLPFGLKLVDCPVLVSNEKAWASLPSKPILDRGRQRTDANDKPAYAAILEWRSRDLADRFSAAVVSWCSVRTGATWTKLGHHDAVRICPARMARCANSARPEKTRDVRLAGLRGDVRDHAAAVRQRR
jgi:hypothetical protein